MSSAAAATPREGIEVRLLGAISIHRDGTENHTLVAQQKCVALLAFLLLAPRDTYQRRDAMVALLWPDSDDERARSSLRTALHRIRSSLGDSIIMSRGTEEVAIDRSRVWCDAIAFEDTASSDAESALVMYRGELLAGFFVGEASAAFDQWLDSVRARFRERAGALAWQRAKEAVRQADLAAASAAATRAVSLAAADESSAREVMSALAARGHRAAAAGLYRELSARLHEGFDVAPSAETTHLVDSLVDAAVPSGSNQVRPAPAIGQPSRIARGAWIGFAALMLGAVLGAYGLVSGKRPAGADVGHGTHWRAWSTVSVAPPRTMSSLVFDAGRDQAIVFGGTSAGLALNDVWRLEGLRGGTGASSTPLAIEGGPRPRWGHAAAFDSVTNRMIVFGGALGHSSPCSNEVWLLENVSGRRGDSRWRQVRPRGEAPSPRANHTAVYDAATNRLIVFGGHDCFARRFDDVWFLDGANGEGRAAWTKVALHSTAPVGRSNHAAVFAARTSTMIALGGVDPDGKALADAWVLDSAYGAARWRQILADGGPPALYCHTAGYNGKEDVLVTFGGIQNSHASSDIWLLSGATTRLDARWTKVSLDSSAGVARACHSAAYDALADRMFVLGGERGSALFTDAWVVEGLRKGR